MMQFMQKQWLIYIEASKAWYEILTEYKCRYTMKIIMDKSSPANDIRLTLKYL